MDINIRFSSAQVSACIFSDSTTYVEFLYQTKISYCAYVWDVCYKVKTQWPFI